jgi:patatin-like phospholipase/acyl hydrolase
MTAVRATTAAPTFFVPVQHEDGLFCDGALVANNPTAIALQEAKQLFPGVPIETVVSIGNHYHHYYQYHHYHQYLKLKNLKKNIWPRRTTCFRRTLMQN